MNLDKSFILGKIYNDAEYAKALLNGTVYINPLASFGAGNLSSKEVAMFNDYRGDLNEGLATNIDVSNMDPSSQVITFFQDIGGIPSNVNAVGEIDTRFLNENVFSLTALFYDFQKGKLQNPNEELTIFNDNNKGLAIVIYDVPKFLTRITQTLSDSLGSPYWVAYGLVDYDFDKHRNTESDEFTKEQTFSYQQEFRIAINISENDCRIRKNISCLTYDSKRGALSLNIGSISDIAFVLSVENYISLQFPDGYQSIEKTEPVKICPFYPPVKNIVSYICPLMRVNNTILISENAMYPIKRNLNVFSINQKRLEKTRMLNPAKDSFFLSILESYFSRMLDIYKCKNDDSLLDQALTAFTHYMLALNIYHCAGIELGIERGLLKASYKNIYLNDISLIDTTCFEIIKKELLPPKPSDFAVLLTLSNQTSFTEYEFEGKKYVRVEVSTDGMLPSGKFVKNGEAIWIEVSKLKFKGY